MPSSVEASLGGDAGAEERFSLVLYLLAAGRLFHFYKDSTAKEEPGLRRAIKVDTCWPKSAFIQAIYPVHGASPGRFGGASLRGAAHSVYLWHLT